MAEDFDPTPYVRPLILDVASGVALGVALITAMPKPAPANVLNAATKVRTRAAEGARESGGWQHGDLGIPASPSRAHPDS